MSEPRNMPDVRRIVLGAGATFFVLLLGVLGGCLGSGGHEHAGHSHGMAEGSVSLGGEAAPEAALPPGNPHPGYCPVMGSEVDLERAAADPALHSDFQGKRYTFCCKRCKPKFDSDPARWIARPAAPRKDGEHAGEEGHEGHEHGGASHSH